MPSGREMYLNDDTTLRRVEVQPASLADMMRIGVQRDQMAQREFDQRRQYALAVQQQEIQRQQLQHSLFKDTHALSQDPRMAANPDAQDAIFGVLGQMAGVPELSQESMKLGRESLKGLYKAALTGDPHQTADAYAELAVRVSNPQDLEKIVGSFAQFDLVREKTEAVRLHKQVEEAKYNQLQDSTVQVEVGRKHYTPAAMHFRDALRGTELPQFSQLSKKITELTIEGDGKKKEVERLLTTQKFPQFNEQGLKSVLEAATQKQQEFQTMADMSTKILDDVHHGVVGMSFAGKAELNHRVSIGQELADSYGKLASWASDPFSKEKLKAAQLAGKTIEEKRVSMDKLHAGNNAMAAQLKQDAFAFRQSEAFLKHASDDEKEQYKRNLETNTVDAKNEFLSLPPAQQTPEAAAKISKAYREKSGVAIAPDIIMKAKTDPNAPQSLMKIDMTQEKAESKKVGDDFGEIYTGIIKAGLATSSSLPKLQRMRSLINKFETSKITPTLTDIQSVADGFGVSVDKSLPDKQQFDMLTKEIALKMRNPADGGGMPGNMSNFDLQYVIEGNPGLGKTTEANKRQLDMMIKLEQRKVELSKVAREYRKKHGASDEGLFDVLQEYADKNPIFEKERKEVGLDAPQGKAQPQSGKAQPQSGAVLKSLPQGAKQVGTYKGKPVYESPDGKRWQEE